MSDVYGQNQTNLVLNHPTDITCENSQKIANVDQTVGNQEESTKISSMPVKRTSSKSGRRMGNL